MKTVNMRIREIREQKGFTQEDIASLLGINRLAISGIENGTRKMSVDELRKFSEIVNISTDDILGINNKEFTYNGMTLSELFPKINKQIPMTDQQIAEAVENVKREMSLELDT